MRISKIKDKFNQAANSYEKVAIPQKTAARHLRDYLGQHYPYLEPSRVMDMGCGTGLMTSALLDLYPKADYILNDLADAMLAQCQKKFNTSQFTYLHGDMDQIQLPQVDLIVSNFSLQWSNHIESCLQRLFQSTQVLAFNCLVEGSLGAWQDLFPKQILMHYPKMKDLRSSILALDPRAHIFCQSIPMIAEHPRALIQQFRALGASTPLEKTSIPHLKQVLQSKAPIHTHYQVLFAILGHRE